MEETKSITLVPIGDMFDESDSKSLVSLLPETIKAELIKLREICEDNDEDSLKKKVNPRRKDEEIRISFWNEYNYAAMHGRKMQIQRIAAGVCSEKHLYWLPRNDPERMAYILCPPKKWEISADYALNTGLDKIVDIINLPIKKWSTKNGVVKETIDIPVCHLIINAYKMLHEQRRGANINRNINYNIDKKLDVPVKPPAEVDAEIEKLESKLKDIEASFSVIENGTGTEGTEVSST